MRVIRCLQAADAGGRIRGTGRSGCRGFCGTGRQAETGVWT